MSAKNIATWSKVVGNEEALWQLSNKCLKISEDQGDGKELQENSAKAMVSSDNIYGCQWEKEENVW